MEKGLKYDTGKTPWHLLPWKQVEKIVDILNYGANKYGPHNWKQGIDRYEDRYFDAALRHLLAWKNGEKNCPESGKSHLAHAATNILFLLFFEDKRANKDKK